MNENTDSIQTEVFLYLQSRKTGKVKDAQTMSGRTATEIRRTHPILWDFDVRTSPPLSEDPLLEYLALKIAKLELEKEKLEIENENLKTELNKKSQKKGILKLW